LKPQGILAYATCSLSKAEGELQIKNFLLNHPDFYVLPINLPTNEKMQTKEGYLRILPSYFKNISGIDGFFIAILQRKI
jgi:16S rRNA (cytosine967-C5)-methyltransferase